MAAKYKIGDIVEVLVERGSHKWNWAGSITKVANVGDDKQEDWEYWVTNAPLLFDIVPLLAWESEVTRY